MNKNILTLILLSIHAIFANAQAPRSYTSSEILLQLKKLSTVGSVLYIAAHPDDENTRLLTYLANEKCVRTGYLSLTRGDGGQNLIGPEQGIELGIIRTQELLAARRIDGAEQFFTRAYDFGYSKSADETFAKWNHDSVLADVVWTIRRFRPDIIITRFSTDGSGGHGQHTASAILAIEAFDAAADPKRFPEQLQYVKVWQARRLFYNSTARFQNPNANMSSLLKEDVGGYNALLGKSYGEIASESRSNHKSQGFGSARQRGQFFEYFKPIKGDTANLKSIFDGIDLSWNRVKDFEILDQQLAALIKNYQVQNPQNSLEEFSKIYQKLQTLQDMNYYYEVILAHKILLNLSGISVDATCSAFQITKGSKQKLNVSIVNRSSAPFQLNTLQIDGVLKNSFLLFDTLINQTLENNISKVFEFQSTTGNFAGNSQPHHLIKSISHDLFVIDNLPYRNSPEVFTDNSIIIQGSIAGTKVNIPKTIQYRWVDPEKGELYRPFVYTPPVMLNLQQKSIVFSDNKSKQVHVTVRAGRDSIASCTVTLNSVDSWKIEPPFIVLSFVKKGDEKVITFNITPLAKSQNEVVKASARIDGDDEMYTKGIREIKYDHIPVQTWFPEAEAELVNVDVKTKLKTIGYIEGAGDEIPNSLEQLGYQVIIISNDYLQNGDLSVYQSIVVGVRAFNTNEKLQQYKQRVFDYVKNGGNLVVQYNTNSFAGPLKEQISPVPFKLSRERVTIEVAPVTFALPDHPVLNTPNKITAKDFEGWVQERGIYFAGDMDSAFQCPLLMNDPNEKPNKGSLIIAKYGKGNYIYTGLALFRQLPAGVPGAYRLFVNLIEYGK
ncbi:MAG: PIG-L family deacetylase [Bacteroidota bacterium]|nr:PIG-L family deacetylase [Bacteroidota bacterium]